MRDAVILISAMEQHRRYYNEMKEIALKAGETELAAQAYRMMEECDAFISLIAARYLQPENGTDNSGTARLGASAGRIGTTNGSA